MFQNTRLARLFRPAERTAFFDGSHTGGDALILDATTFGVDRTLPVGEISSLTDDEKLDLVTYGARDSRRVQAADERRQKARGQRAYSRQQRALQVKDETRALQAELLESDDPAKANMRRNLEVALERQRAAEQRA